MPTFSAPRGLTRGALVVLLVAVATVAVPFKDGDHTCKPAAWSAFRDDRLYGSELSTIGHSSEGETFIVFCETKARTRLEASGALVAVAGVMYAVSRRTLTRTPVPSSG